MRSPQIALNVAKLGIRTRPLETSTSVSCCRRGSGAAGAGRLPEHGNAFLCFPSPDARPALCLAAEQGMCASNQTLISSGASRRCLLQVVAVAGYQGLIPASCASLSAKQGYPHFLTFTRRAVCCLRGENSC